MRSTCAARFALVILGVAVLLFIETASSANAAEPKRILVIDSFAPGTSPFAPFNSAFRDHMLRAWPAQVAFYEVPLDSWRPGIQENENALIEVIRTRFFDLRMDLVVARGTRAGQFYVKYRDELFRHVPLLLTGDEASLSSARLRSGDSFVANRIPAIQMVGNLLNLLPNTSTIAVVFGTSPPEQYWVNRLKDEFAPLAGRVKFVWLDHLSLPEMRQRVATSWGFSRSAPGGGAPRLNRWRSAGACSPYTRTSAEGLPANCTTMSHNAWRTLPSTRPESSACSLRRFPPSARPCTMTSCA
jgi:hypothetical protein